MKKWAVTLMSLLLWLNLSACSGVHTQTQESEPSTVSEVSEFQSRAESNVESYDEKSKEESKETSVITENSTAHPSETNVMLQIKINGYTLKAEFQDNSSAQALKEKLEEAPLTLDMHDYGSFEKVGDLPFSLVTNDTYITTEPGDIILYQGHELTIYYDVNSWSFTRVAKIVDTDAEMLRTVLGDDSITAEFSLT